MTTDDPSTGSQPDDDLEPVGRDVRDSETGSRELGLDGIPAAELVNQHEQITEDAGYQRARDFLAIDALRDQSRNERRRHHRQTRNAALKHFEAFGESVRLHGGDSLTAAQARELYKWASDRPRR